MGHRPAHAIILRLLFIHDALRTDGHAVRASGHHGAIQGELYLKETTFLSFSNPSSRCRSWHRFSIFSRATMPPSAHLRWFSYFISFWRRNCVAPFGAFFVFTFSPDRGWFFGYFISVYEFSGFFPFPDFLDVHEGDGIQFLPRPDTGNALISAFSERLSTCSSRFTASERFGGSHNDL